MNVPNITHLPSASRTGGGFSEYHDNAGALGKALLVVTVTDLDPGASVALAVQGPEGTDYAALNSIDRPGEYRIAFGGNALASEPVAMMFANDAPPRYRVRYAVNGGGAVFGITGVEV